MLDGIQSHLKKLPLTKDDVGRFDGIIKKACELALDFGKQRCRLQLDIPDQYAPWDEQQSVAMMERYAGDDLPSGFVDYVVVPGVRRYGDGHGDNLDKSAVLVPAKVAIEAEVPKRS